MVCSFDFRAYDRGLGWRRVRDLVALANRVCNIGCPIAGAMFHHISRFHAWVTAARITGRVDLVSHLRGIYDDANQVLGQESQLSSWPCGPDFSIRSRNLSDHYHDHVAKRLAGRASAIPYQPPSDDRAVRLCNDFRCDDLPSAAASRPEKALGFGVVSAAAWRTDCRALV